METSVKTRKLLKFIYDKHISGDLKNKDLVQIIELCGGFLNLKSISDYAKENKMSYNGVKNHRKTVYLFNKKFVIDNE